jgi:hypothetical protein
MTAQTHNEKQTIPYYNELFKIRLALELSTKIFPEGQCTYATSILEKKFNTIQGIAGLYLPEKSWHAWGYDTKYNVFVDITMDQFNPEHDEIMILQPTTHLLLPKADELKRYHAHKQTKEFKEQLHYLEKCISKL